MGCSEPEGKIGWCWKISRGKENETKALRLSSVGHRLLPDKVAVRPEHVLPVHSPPPPARGGVAQHTTMKGLGSAFTA